MEPGNHPIPRIRDSWLLLFLPLAFLCVGFTICSTASAKSKTITNPTSLKFTYDGRIATDKRDLYLASVTSGGWGAYYVQVSRYRGNKWTVLPGHPLTPEGFIPNDENGIQLALLKSPRSKFAQPCIGDTFKDQGRVRCLKKGKWKKLKTPSELSGMKLDTMIGRGDTAIALFSKASEHSTKVRVARIEDGSLVPIGAALDLEGQVEADLGEVTQGVGDSKIDVGLQGKSPMNEGQRTLATLSANAWTLSDPITPSSEVGFQRSGPVRSPSSVYFPVVQPLPAPKNSPISYWNYSIFDYRNNQWSQVGGQRINRLEGANAGSVSAVGARIWTVWSSLPLIKGRPQPRLYAARISENGSSIDKRVALEKDGAVHESFYPQAVKYRGQTVFAYMRNGKTWPVITLKFMDK